ncbi:unnamed protein product [Bursaphelenchus xylophilus]|uniref:(pine wood nematode) hypothetical protein n=1 Tax=Bursaphelenchus xylophilus TaxID=6326 RepID=A0A1I7RK32_BURXY|nr:unnamed protein product [Bursaphelenchus xylophilus]CAG9131543.1 unnamed protein product [Bursaphelenchus xylophilus]
MIFSPVLLGAQGVYMYPGGIIFPQTTFLGHAIAPCPSEGSISPASLPGTSQSPLSSQPSCSYTTPSPTGSVALQETSKNSISLIKGRLPIFVQIHEKGLREKEPSARRRRPRRPRGPTHYKTAVTSKRTEFARRGKDAGSPMDFLN